MGGRFIVGGVPFYGYGLRLPFTFGHAIFG